MKRVCLHILFWAGICLLPAPAAAQQMRWKQISAGKLSIREIESVSLNHPIDSVIRWLEAVWQPGIIPAAEPAAEYRLLLARLLLMKGQTEKAEEALMQICSGPESKTTLQRNMLLGWVAKLRGDYNSASAQLYPILPRAIAASDSTVAAMTCLLLAQLNMQIGHPAGAESFVQKGMEISKLTDNSFLPARFLIQQSEESIRQQEYPTALALLGEAECQLQQNPSLFDLVRIYNNRGRINTALGKFTEAEKWYRQSLGIKKRLGDRPGMATLHNNLGDLYAQQYLDDAATREFHSARLLAIRINAPEIEMTACYNLSLLTEENGQAGASMRYYKRYAELKDSLNNADNVKKIIALHKKYELADREKIISDLSRQTLHQASLLQRKTRERNILIGGIGLLLLLIGLYARGYYQKQKLNRQVSAQNEELRQLGKLKDQIFLMLGHDLRMPLNSLTDMPMLIEYCINTNQLHKLRTAGQEIDITMKYINNLVDNLLTWALHQTHQLAFHPQKLNLHAIAGQVMEGFTETLARKQIRLHNQIDPSAEVWADANALKVVIRNLLHNAGKFTQQGNVILNARKNGEEYIIAVSDEGSGIEEEKIPLLFGNWPDREPGRRSTGLGLYLSKQMVELHKGIIQLKSKRGAGTIVSFTIPSA